MHSAHHWLLGASRAQLIGASTPADTAASAKSDAERVGRSGVQFIPFPSTGFDSTNNAMSAPYRRLAVVLAMLVVGTFACDSHANRPLDPARRAAIADSLTSMIKAAYDLEAKDVVGRFMSFYPDSGRVISASGGRVTTTRDS